MHHRPGDHDVRLVHHDHPRHPRRCGRGERRRRRTAHPVRPRALRRYQGGGDGRPLRHGDAAAHSDARQAAAACGRGLRKESSMSLVLWAAIAIFSAAIIVGLVRVATAKDLGSRAIISDLVYFSAIGILTMIAMLTDMSIMMDVIFLSSLLGILATIALARILTRGHR